VAVGVSGTIAPPRFAAWLRPWMCVTALLIVCAAKGVWFTLGMEVPPDEDIVRDLGFIQGILDGNWFGDPTNQGAWRWYPPLLHGLAAAGVAISGVDLLPSWVRAGAWLNLASPLCFYLMNTRLIGRWPAVVATAALVLFDSAVMSGDEAAGYTPWTLTPALAWPAFFSAVWLVLRHAPSLRWGTAILVGTVLGLVFLAHTIPAVLLSGITASVVLTARGVSRRAVVWLCVTATIALAWASLFVGPLLLAYRLHIANPVPGAWVHGLLKPDAVEHILLLNLPGLLALPALAWLSRPAAAALATWIGLCLAFLLRHYVCAWSEGGVACTLLVIAPHHYHVYLQAAWASLVGIAVWRGITVAPWPATAALGTVAVLAGLAGTSGHSPDVDRRSAALDRPDAVLDRAVYRWILRHTNPQALFVTLLPIEADRMGASVATIFAAGRRLVAPPEVHGNPYLPWAPMNMRRLDYLAGGDAALCRFQTEAGAEAGAWFLLPPNDSTPRVTLMFRSTDHALYRVDPAVCDAAMP
jgi:hypothetical protein